MRNNARGCGPRKICRSPLFDFLNSAGSRRAASFLQLCLAVGENGESKQWCQRSRMPHSIIVMKMNPGDVSTTHVVPHKSNYILLNNQNTKVHLFYIENILLIHAELLSLFPFLYIWSVASFLMVWCELGVVLISSISQLSSFSFSSVVLLSHLNYYFQSQTNPSLTSFFFFLAGILATIKILLCSQYLKNSTLSM